MTKEEYILSLANKNFNTNCFKKLGIVKTNSMLGDIIIYNTPLNMMNYDISEIRDYFKKILGNKILLIYNNDL